MVATDRAEEAFEAWCEAGCPSLVGFARARGEALATVKRWSAQHNWQGRRPPPAPRPPARVKLELSDVQLSGKEIRNLCLRAAPRAIRALLAVLDAEDTPATARVSAARDLLDRAGVMPPQRPYGLVAGEGEIASPSAQLGAALAALRSFDGM